MFPSKVIRVQRKKNTFIFIFIFIFLALNIFYFYFSSFRTSELHTSLLYLGVGAISIVLGVINYFCTGDLCLAWRRNRSNDSSLIKTVEEGTRPEIDVSDEVFFPRPIITDNLKAIFQPAKDQSCYYTICGEHGTGKTTLIRFASREVGRGVVYVDIPPIADNFGEAFGKAINFAFEEDVSLNNQLRRKLGSTDNKPKWVRALNAFQHAAEMYKVKYEKPMVIVYDNISRLDPEIIRILQDSAKDNADSRTYIAVFVSSEGSVPKIMENNSSYSRASGQPIEIGDLSKDESIEYLIEKRNVKEEEAERLYELVGGRMIDLKAVADESIDGNSFEVIKGFILNKTEKKFTIAKMYSKQKYFEVGCQIINSLLKYKELDFYEYLKFFNDYEEADEVLEKNVFAYHPEKNTVSFQSQSVESYIKTEADLFGIQLVKLTPTDEDDVNSNQATTSNQW